MSALVEIIKSPSDKKSYRHIKLDNGLSALLIHDPEILEESQLEGDTSSEEGDKQDGMDMCECNSTSGSSSSDSVSDHGEEDGVGHDQGRPVKRAAVSMAVGIGSFSDPETLPGLSHYLEHMLFMGSEQFPDENEYDAFLTRHGGSSNAFTELEYTNFHFDCSARALGRALERFAGFFTAPLCKEDALEREVNAVDHEFNDVLQNDSCRLSQLMCATSRDKHVYRKFTWGNKRSLWDLPQQQGVPVRERLLEYYAQHYGGERMSLCVMGGEQLDELEALVRRLFSGVRSGVGRSPTFERAGFPFEGSRLHITKSVNQQNVVNVTFQLPSLFDRYKTKAEDYIGHLVGHEGSGSFLSALKDRGWATEVMAGIDDDGYSRNSAVFLFTVSITLTEAGLAATPGAGLAAVALLFEYLTLLRSAGPLEWVYKEMRSIGDMKFRFEEEDDGMDFVTSVASRMPHFSVPYLLFGHYCHELWDPQLVQQLLELMTPHSDGFRVDVQAHSIDRLLHDLAQLGSALQTSQEPWFHFPFHSCDLPQDLLTSWADAAPSSDLRLPPANCYIPTDFALLSPAAAPAEAAAAGGGKDAGAGSLPVPPAMVADEPGMRVWYKMDSTFLTPRCNVYFRIASPVLARSAREAALAALLVKVLEDAVNEDTYLADIAGLHWCVSAGGCAGLDLRIDGFNQQLPLLAAKLMQALAALQPNPRTFAAVQEALVRRLRNANLEPGRLASYLRLFALGHHRWHVDELLAEAEKLQPQDIPAFRQQLLAEVHLEMLAIGNISQTQALSVAGTAAAALASGGSALAAAARPSPRCLKLREGSRLCHVVYGKNPDNENSACENYWQCGPDTPRARALVELLEQLMHEPCYDTLRTKQQLGYVVQSGMRCTHGVLGFFIAIVSSSHSASHLDSCIDQFLTDYARQLKKLPRKELEENVASLVELQLEKCRNLTEEGDRHWDTIWGQKYDFRRRAAVVGELRSISLKDMVKFFNTNLLPSAATARKLSVQVRRHGQQPAEDPVEDGRVVVPDLGALKASLDAYPAFTRAPQPHQQRKR